MPLTPGCRPPGAGLRAQPTGIFCPPMPMFAPPMPAFCPSMPLFAPSMTAFCPSKGAFAPSKGTYGAKAGIDGDSSPVFAASFVCSDVPMGLGGQKTGNVPLEAVIRRVAPGTAPPPWPRKPFSQGKTIRQLAYEKIEAARRTTSTG